MYEIKPEVFELSNGVRVVYQHAPSQVAHLGVTILAGSRYENSNEVGLAHYLEHCIFKGTQKRKAFHILSRLDSVGGEINAYTTKEEIAIYAAFTKNHFERASELLADITLNSSFPEKEIQKEKEIIIDEINSYLDSPTDKIVDDFEYYLFQGHALGNNILGSKDSVNAFERSDLLKYVSELFRADNIVISFVGDVKKEIVHKVLENDFKSCNKSDFKREIKTFDTYKPFHIREKIPNYQSHAMIGGIAPSHDEEDRKCISLLINVLGGPAMNSRLNLSVREKYGYSYTIESNYSAFVDTGYWAVYFGTDFKYLEKTISLVHKELKLLCDKKIGVQQLKSAKEQLKGHLALSLDNNSGLMLGLGKSLLLFNQIDTIEDIYQSIDKLTADNLIEVANKYFSPEILSDLIFESEK
jgi:predicted Zn-dependent peptidase